MLVLNPKEDSKKIVELLDRFEVVPERKREAFSIFSQYQKDPECLQSIMYYINDDVETRIESVRSLEKRMQTINLAERIVPLYQEGTSKIKMSIKDALAVDSLIAEAKFLSKKARLGQDPTPPETPRWKQLLDPKAWEILTLD